MQNILTQSQLHHWVTYTAPQYVWPVVDLKQHHLCICHNLERHGNLEQCVTVQLIEIDSKANGGKVWISS